MGVALLVVMIVLLRLVVDVIVFMSEQNTRIDHLIPEHYLPVNMGMGVRVVGYMGMGCGVLRLMTADNTFKFQFMTIDGIHLANIFLAYRW